MVIKSWCRYFTGKFIRAWPAITLHAPDMNEKLWEKKRKLEDAYDRVMSELEDYSTGMTMTEVVDYLSDEYGWSRSVPNLSGKLKRGLLRYGEAVELADALGYDIVWEKR